jgi:hypothetical protein
MKQSREEVQQKNQPSMINEGEKNQEEAQKTS